MTAQDLDADRVERAEPRHALDLAADELADALLHLARGLVGEGHGEDLAAAGAAGGEDVGDTGGEDARLAGSSAGQNKQGAVERLDRLALLRVQPFEIRHSANGTGAGTLRDGTRYRLRRGRHGS